MPVFPEYDFSKVLPEEKWSDIYPSCLTKFPSHVSKSAFSIKDKIANILYFAGHSHCHKYLSVPL